METIEIVRESEKLIQLLLSLVSEYWFGHKNQGIWSVWLIYNQFINYRRLEYYWELSSADKVGKKISSTYAVWWPLNALTTLWFYIFSTTLDCIFRCPGHISRIYVRGRKKHNHEWNVIEHKNVVTTALVKCRPLWKQWIPLWNGAHQRRLNWANLEQAGPSSPQSEVHGGDWAQTVDAVQSYVNSFYHHCSPVMVMRWWPAWSPGLRKKLKRNWDHWTYHSCTEPAGTWKSPSMLPLSQRWHKKMWNMLHYHLRQRCCVT